MEDETLSSSNTASMLERGEHPIASTPRVTDGLFRTLDSWREDKSLTAPPRRRTSFFDDAGPPVEGKLFGSNRK